MKTACIVVKNHHYSDSRVEKIAVSLNNVGFEVYVIAASFFNFSPYEIKKKYNVYRINCDSDISFCINALNIIKKQKASLVWCCDVNTFYTAILCKRFNKNIVTIADYHEYWHHTPRYNDKTVNRNIDLIFQRFSSNYFDEFITVNNSIAKMLKKDLVIKKDFQIIYNTPYFVENVISKKEARERYNIPKNIKIVLYQGLIVSNRNIGTLIKCLKDIPELYFYLIGEDRMNGYFQKLAEHEKVSDRVVFNDPLPHKEMMDFLRVADIGYVGVEGSCKSFKYSTANKIFEDIMAEIPVLSTKLPGSYNILKQYKKCVFFKSGNTNSLLNALNKISNLNLKKEYIISIKKKYSWENQERKINNILKKYIFFDGIKTDIDLDHGFDRKTDFNEILIVRSAPEYAIESFINNFKDKKISLLSQPCKARYFKEKYKFKIENFPDDGFFKLKHITKSFFMKLFKRKSKDVVILTAGDFEDNYTDKWRFFILFKLAGFKIYGYGPSETLKRLSIIDFIPYIKEIPLMIKKIFSYWK